jgi:hypothetical protein
MMGWMGWILSFSVILVLWKWKIPAVPLPTTEGSGYVLKHVSNPYTVFSTVVTTALTIGNCEVLE